MRKRRVVPLEELAIKLDVPLAALIKHVEKLSSRACGADNDEVDVDLDHDDDSDVDDSDVDDIDADVATNSNQPNSGGVVLIDERGRAVFVDDDQLERMAVFIETRGRVSVEQLADELNNVVKEIA